MSPAPFFDSFFTLISQFLCEFLVVNCIFSQNNETSFCFVIPHLFLQILGVKMWSFVARKASYGDVMTIFLQIAKNRKNLQSSTISVILLPNPHADTHAPTELLPRSGTLEAYAPQPPPSRILPERSDAPGSERVNLPRLESFQILNRSHAPEPVGLNLRKRSRLGAFQIGLTLRGQEG